MSEVLISAVRPQDVARDVEASLARGAVERFVILAVAGGGMLDQERLGAARYAAARQAEVRLEVGESEPTPLRAR